MRHSSWTPFLVPLALPLVLLCIPGAGAPVDTEAPEVQPASEYVAPEYQELASSEFIVFDPVPAPGPKA